MRQPLARRWDRAVAPLPRASRPPVESGEGPRHRVVVLLARVVRRHSDRDVAVTQKRCRIQASNSTTVRYFLSPSDSLLISAANSMHSKQMKAALPMTPWLPTRPQKLHLTGGQSAGLAKAVGQTADVRVGDACDALERHDCPLASGLRAGPPELRGGGGPCAGSS